MLKNVNGVILNVYETWNNRGENLLLLHGWGCEIKMMKPVADAMKDRFDVIIPDLPGHGESGKPPEPWGVPEYAECVYELLKSCNFLPCSVIAHSFGCRIATWIATTHPEAFEKMVFTGAAGIRPKQSEEAKKRSESYQKKKKFLQQIQKLPLMKNPGEKLLEALRDKHSSPDYKALDEDMKKTFVKIVNLDLSDRYEQFTQSTLLIWGDADKETPLWMAKEMEKKIPDAGLVILEGGTHFAYLEQLPRFNQIARYFLTEE